MCYVLETCPFFHPFIFLFDFYAWCASQWLQLNADKTEAIWVSSKHNLAKLQQYYLTLTVGTETIRPVNVIRNLGVWIDHELSMKQHIVKVASACFHQLRHLRQIRRRVGREVKTRLVLALVMSRLDYCNSLLAGLPASTVNILQRVQNPLLASSVIWMWTCWIVA